MATNGEFTERLLWTLLLGATTTAAGWLASRAAREVWIRWRGVPPPDDSGMIGMLGRKAGERSVMRLGFHD